MTKHSSQVNCPPLRRPKLLIDGWSLTGRQYKTNLERTKESAFVAIKEWIKARNVMPSPKELCCALGYVPDDHALFRFRIHWRDFLLSELPRLEHARIYTYSQVLGVMQSIATPTSRWIADIRVREAKLIWFCDHLLNNTDLELTNKEIIKNAFGNDTRSFGMPNYTKIVRSFRGKELSKILDQLSALPVKDIVDGPSSQAQALLDRIKRLWVSKLRVPPKVDPVPLIRSICDYIISSKNLVPTYNGLREILAFIPSSNVMGYGFMNVLKQWRRDRGYPAALRGNMNAALARTWETLVPTLADVIRTAPHTFLDPRAKPGRFRKFDDNAALYLGRCEDLTIRSALALAVMNCCGNHSTIPRFASGLKQIIEAGGLTGLTDPRMEDTLRAFVTGDLQLDELPDDTGDDDENNNDERDTNTGSIDDEGDSGNRWSNSKICDFFRMYRLATYSQQRYLQDLTPTQREQIQPYLFPTLKDQFFWRASSFSYIVGAAQKKRRKARTDALFPHRGLIRTLPEFRTNQANRVRTAFRIAVTKFESGQISLPHDFSVYEEEPHLGPPTQHQFRLWSRTTLSATYRSSERSERWADGNLRQSELWKKQYFVEYLGALDNQGKPSTNELWFADIIRFNACHADTVRDNKTTDFRRSYGIPGSQYKALWPMLCGSRTLSSSLVNLIRAVRTNDRNFRPIYFSPEGLYAVCLFGRIANRILNISGCRANELQQLHASADCLVKIELEQRSAAYAFMAIPKLHNELEPFFIDESCVKFIGDLAKCVKNNSPTGSFPKVPGALNLAGHKRTRPLPYLFQTMGREPHAMSPGTIGGLVRFMLHGMQFITIDGKRFQPGLHDLRHLTGTTLRSQGVPLEVIAKMFKQKDLKVTDYYSEPTTSMVVAAMHGLQFAVLGAGAAAGVRKPDELQQQLSDANGVVGALTKVLAGDCTIPSPCAVKFACLGCAGLVPDHREREHVLRNKERLQQDLAHHTTHGMLAEVRKNGALIADCDRVLAEMDLQEAAENDAKNSTCND